MRQGPVETRKVVATFLAELVQDQPTRLAEEFQMLSLYTNLAVRLRRDEKGATAVEYGIMVSLIAVVIIIAVTALGGTLHDLFVSVRCSMVGGAVSGTSGAKICSL
jgi:pilus assembly protein Flp/PilA